LKQQHRAFDSSIENSTLFNQASTMRQPAPPAVLTPAPVDECGEDSAPIAQAASERSPALAGSSKSASIA